MGNTAENVGAHEVGWQQSNTCASGGRAAERPLSAAAPRPPPPHAAPRPTCCTRTLFLWLRALQATAGAAQRDWWASTWQPPTAADRRPGAPCLPRGRAQAGRRAGSCPHVSALAGEGAEGAALGPGARNCRVAPRMLCALPGAVKAPANLLLRAASLMPRPTTPAHLQPRLVDFSLPSYTRKRAVAAHPHLHSRFDRSPACS